MTMTPAAFRLGPVFLDPAPRPFRPAKDVFASFRRCCVVVVGRIAVAVTIGRLARHPVSARFVAYLDRRSWNAPFKLEKNVARLLRAIP